MSASDVANRIKQSYTLPDAGIVLTDTVVLRDLDAPPAPRTKTPGKRVKVYWRGKTAVPVFALENVNGATIQHLDVHVEAPTDAAFVCERAKTGPGTVTPTHAQFRDVRIFGNGMAVIGIDYCATIDENNEHLRADCVSVYGCKVAGFVFSGQQSKEHTLTLCRITGALSGIEAQSSFTMISGTIAGCADAVTLLAVGDPVTLIGVGVEACGRLLVSHGPTTDAQPIVLQNVRYAADQLADDGAMILLRHAGPLTIIGGTYGDGDQRPPHIQLAGIGEQAITIIGAKFGAFGANQSSPVHWNPGVRPSAAVYGCTYERPKGSDEHSDTVLDPVT